MSIKPEGENIRNAVKWISDEKQYEGRTDIAALVDEACVKFDLSPKEADYLLRFFSGKEE